MSERRIALYYTWSRPAETKVPLDRLENRWPTLFEVRRLFWPKLEAVADPARFEQEIGGFLDNVIKANYQVFAAYAEAHSGSPILQLERETESAGTTPLDKALLDTIDTLIVLGYNSSPTAQTASADEIAAVESFLAKPGNVAFVCPHHEIGVVDPGERDAERKIQEAEFLHHGDKAIPPRQDLGGFTRSLLAGLGIPVKNRFGLRPALLADGSPAPIEIDRSCDRLRLLDGITALNSHPHLPHFERLGPAIDKLDVLARQEIDPSAPLHPAFPSGRGTFDAVLQSKLGVFSGSVVVCDSTLWSSTAGGIDNLRRLWSNVIDRNRPGASSSVS